MLEKASFDPTYTAQLLEQKLADAPPKIGLAVSGGADSMALLFLVSQILPAERLLVLTVDHALRPESAGEAEMVEQWCREHSIQHLTLRWTDDKPVTGIQAAARAARYRLMASACEEHGAAWLLTAHNKDDQAETIFARFARGGGLSGLSGMKERRKVAAGAGKPVMLVRPLIEIARADLRALVRAVEVPFVDDPSNEDVRYERVRRRGFLAAMFVQDLLNKEALLKTAEKLTPSERLQEQALHEGFKACRGYVHGSGAIRFDLARLRNCSGELCAILLSRAIWSCSGQEYAPDQEAIERLVCELRQTPKTSTLGGSMIMPVKRDLWIMREPSALLGRADGGHRSVEMQVSTGARVLWDSRMIVDIPAGISGELTLRPLGDGGSGTRLEQVLFATVPSLMRENKLIGLPNYVKNIQLHDPVTWKQGTHTLDMVSLIKERFHREVIRF